MVQKFYIWVYTSIPTRTENKDLYAYLCTLVYSSIIHMSQKVEATHAHWQMNG